MKEFYFIAVLSKISECAGCIAICTACAIIGFILGYIAINSTTYLDEGDKNNLILCKKAIKLSSYTTIVCALLYVFIPSKQDMYLMYGIGNTIDYIKSKDKAKELPDKIIDVCDAYLESIMDKTNK